MRTNWLHQRVGPDESSFSPSVASRPSVWNWTRNFPKETAFLWISSEIRNNHRCLSCEIIESWEGKQSRPKINVKAVASAMLRRKNDAFLTANNLYLSGKERSLRDPLKTFSTTHLFHLESIFLSLVLAAADTERWRDDDSVRISRCHARMIHLL